MNPLKPVNSTTTFFAGKYPEEKTNEVARLRELLDKITNLAESLSGYYYASLCDMQECPAKEWGKGHQKLLADNLEHFKKEARLAPAPEEPANPTCANTQHKFSHCDCEKPTPIETAPEWRGLLPDEVIQEGDEYSWSGGLWHEVDESVGSAPSRNRRLLFRTHRPLPKQEEKTHEQKVMEKHCGHKGVCDPDLGCTCRLAKQDEWLSAFSYSLCILEDSGESDELLRCLRYLRDEIEQLKKNQK